MANLRRRCGFIIGTMLTLGVVAEVTRAATTLSVATFENFGQQFIPIAFTDPISGITFSNGQGTAGYFGIQHSNAFSTYLTGNGLAGGGGTSLNGNFGFDGSWTTPVSIVSLDLIYSTSTGGTMMLTGYDSGNNAVALFTTSQFTLNHTMEKTISATSLNSSITHFSVRASGLFTGYDNITLSVPEPGGAVLLAPALLLALSWRRGRRTTQ